MKKLLSIIALLAMLLVASSGFNESEARLSVGDKVPQIAVSNQFTSFDSETSLGQYVLLTFWSSSDAQSRIDCNRYSAWFAAHGVSASEVANTGIKHIAINFDNQPALFNELVRVDNLDKKAQFNVNGLEAAKIINGFGLTEGFGSVLISPDGRITSFNPSTSDLSSLI